MMKIENSPNSQRVSDCLTWHYGYSAKGNERTAPISTAKDGNNRIFGSDKYLGYSDPSPESYIPGDHYMYGDVPVNNFPQNTRPHDDRVIDALRGWPRQKNADLSTFDEPKQIGTEPVTDEKKDPYMVDLMAHAYVNCSAKDNSKQGSASKRASLKSGGKPTRTSMMRHNVNNEKAHPVEHDLWKMPKFTKGAKPAISSFRVSSGGKTKKTSGQSRAELTMGDNYGLGKDFASGGCNCGYSHGEYSNYEPLSPYKYSSPDAYQPDSDFKLPPISSEAAPAPDQTYNWTTNFNVTNTLAEQNSFANDIGYKSFETTDPPRSSPMPQAAVKPKHAYFEVAL